MRLERYSRDAVAIGSRLVHMTDFVVSVSTWSRGAATVVGRSGVSTRVDVGTATTWLNRKAVQVPEVEDEA